MVPTGDLQRGFTRVDSLKLSLHGLIVDLAPARLVNVHQAKTNLSRLLQDVERGHEVVIARSGVPIARLPPQVPCAGRSKWRMTSMRLWMSSSTL